VPSLREETCAPCRGGDPPASPEQRKEWLETLPEWSIEPDGSGIPELRRTFKFKDFKEALDFTVKLGELAEKQDHHPAVLVEWGRATVRWSTHKIKNLHRNDFVMAAKTDALYESASA
jgi:4a-hydroxytetrahydrobiopterin dehydratase